MSRITITIKIVTLAITLSLTLPGKAQNKWSIDDCMRYAAEHAHTVRQAELKADNYRTERREAIGAFLPKVSATGDLQLSSGRTIDNETNTYGNYSQLYNYYGLSASLTLFSGGKLINNLREANRRRDMGRSALQSAQDKVAIDVLAACVDVLYYQGLEEVCEAKLATSDSIHHQTVRYAELGLKSDADAAQTAQQVAADKYDLIHNAGLLATAQLNLRHLMQLPDSVAIELIEPEETETGATERDADRIYEAAATTNPDVTEARMSSEAATYAHKAARGNLMPTLTLYAGISSNYYKYLNVDNYEAASFAQQMKGHRGQYITAELTIPIFSGLSRSSTVRQRRNDKEIAEDKYREALDELRTNILKAIVDCQNAEAELEQLTAKVETDSIAYHSVRRQFEEGLNDPLELRTAANTLATSEAALLQGRLTLIAKRRYIEYLYSGKLF